MCLGMIALHTTNTCWKSSIDDIIIFSNRGPSQLFIALNIIKNICITFESKMFSERETSLIKRWLLENVASVFQFINNVL